MKATQIKTIDVHCKEWFDKVNGNSYFSGEVVVNAGKKTETIIKIPFQYGYGEQYRHEAFKLIQKELKCMKSFNTGTYAYRKYNIKATYNKKDNCLKRELC